MLGSIAMNPFFINKFEYITDDPIEDVRDRVQSLISRKWYDFSENITGRRTENGGYVLTTKWNFIYTTWIESSGAYLRIKLEKTDSKTQIIASLRPNSNLIFFFYLIVIIFFIELVGGPVVEGPKIYTLLFLTFFDLILFLMMKMFMTGLKKRFERLVQLRPT